MIFEPRWIAAVHCLLKRCLLTVTVLVGTASLAFGGFDEGLAAYRAKDYAKALRELLPVAEFGHSEAQYIVGVLFNDGTGAARDFSRARSWFERAASQGHASAQVNLGVMYEHGHGVLPDSKLAAEWYRKAAYQGSASGEVFLGIMYAKGEGVERDDNLAVIWFQRAADQGLPRTYSLLGDMYSGGRAPPRQDHGLPRQDVQAAAAFYRKAAALNIERAEQGDAEAQGALGFAYANGQGVEKNESKAIDRFRKAAEQGDEIAAHNLRFLLGKSIDQPK